MLCKKHNIYLIEDTAEAFGSKYNDRCLGTFGDISTFSFLEIRQLHLEREVWHILTIKF